MRIPIPLLANQPLRQFFSARCVAIKSTGAASEVSLTLFRTSQQDAEDFGAVGRNFSVFNPDAPFCGVELTSTVDCTVELIVSGSNVQMLDGSNVTATLDGSQLPLPVVNDRGGNALTPLYVSGLTYSDAPAATVTDRAAVAASSVIANLLAADATRQEVIFYNIGPDPVALGMVGITWAKRAIVLSAGDMYVDDRAAQKAWYAITDAGGAASVTVQERKS